MSYKTQCPRCQTIYPMPAEKLGDDKARANCGKCRHTFFLNAHLIEETEEVDDPAPRRSFIRKKAKVQDNNTDDMSMDGFDDFLNKETSPSQADDDNDEAWFDELINNDSDPAKTTPTTQHKDDLSELIGADLDSLIPTVPDNNKKPEVIQQKINERIAHTPSQEQLLTKRSLLGQVMWGIGVLGLLGFLAGQYVFFNADGLAKTGKAAFISNLCQSCLPSANISALTTTYSLQNGQADFTTDLIGVISNTSTTAQLYPNLKITVTGKHGLIGDLAVAPKDYLDTPQKLIGASSNGRFMLTLDAPANEIVSVTIEPFY